MLNAELRIASVGSIRMYTPPEFEHCFIARIKYSIWAAYIADPSTAIENFTVCHF